MKYSLIIVSLLVSIGFYSQESEIYGHWKLQRIETKSGILIPEKKDYFLTISSDSVSYNLEINNCWATLTLNDKRISYNVYSCTEVCCDGRNDSISNFISYNGTYERIRNQLIITTEDSKLFLEQL